MFPRRRREQSPLNHSFDTAETFRPPICFRNPFRGGRGLAWLPDLHSRITFRPPLLLRIASHPCAPTPSICSAGRFVKPPCYSSSFRVAPFDLRGGSIPRCSCCSSLRVPGSRTSASRATPRPRVRRRSLTACTRLCTLRRASELTLS